MNRIRITVAACLMSISALAYGQPSHSPGKGKAEQGENKESWKERMKAEKKNFITQELALSEEMAENFWAKYDEISLKQWKANKAVMDCRKALEDARNTEGADFKTLLDRLVKAESNLSKVNSKAVEEFRECFGDEMAAKLIVAEERFRRNQIHRLNKGKGGPDGPRPPKPQN